jgi:hypothetical protein
MADEKPPAGWTQEFTFHELALALVQFSIARGGPTPIGMVTEEPIIEQIAAGRNQENYIRLRYAKRSHA